MGFENQGNCYRIDRIYIFVIWDKLSISLSNRNCIFKVLSSETFFHFDKFHSFMYRISVAYAKQSRCSHMNDFVRRNIKGKSLSTLKSNFFNVSNKEQKTYADAVIISYFLKICMKYFKYMFCLCLFGLKYDKCSLILFGNHRSDDIY